MAQHLHFTGSAVLVRDGQGISWLHAWPRGWFGELTYEAAPQVPQLPSSHVIALSRRVLQLSLSEAFYLAFLLPGGPALIPVTDLAAACAGSVALPSPQGLCMGKSWRLFVLRSPRLELASCLWIVRPQTALSPSSLLRPSTWT